MMHGVVVRSSSNRILDSVEKPDMSVYVSGGNE